MIRNLKALLLTALAVTAFSAPVASVAQASPKFTSVSAGAAETTTLFPAKDGTGKTSHHMFDFENFPVTSSVSVTCEEITSTGTMVGSEKTEILFVTPAYKGCTAAGQVATVTNTGCNFNFKANGEMQILNESGKECAHGKAPIDIEFTGCKVEIGTQNLAGVKYHNLNTAGTTVKSNEGSKVTIQPAITGITYNAKGAACEYGTTSNGTYTTGNVIVAGSRPNGIAEVRWDEV
jgi:hypothetical protein